MKTVAYSLSPMTLVLLAIMLVLSGCNNNASDSNSDGDSSNASTPPLPPPAIRDESLDGDTLNEQQVLLYIEVKRREKQLLEINRNASPEVSRHYEEIEKQAAQESSIRIEEYLWIKNNIIKTGTQAMLNDYFKLNNKIIALLKKTLARRMETRALTEVPEEVERIDIHINEIKQQLADLEFATNKYIDRTDAMNHNLQLFRKHKAQLESVRR